MDRSITINYCIKNSMSYRLSSLKDCLNEIDKSFHPKIYDSLGIRNEEVLLTDEIKNNILQKLIDSKAFYADSAAEMAEDLDNCYQMLKLGIIKQYDGGFYLDREDVPNLFSYKVLDNIKNKKIDKKMAIV